MRSTELPANPVADAIRQVYRSLDSEISSPNQKVTQP
jgi:hypothetical protein